MDALFITDLMTLLRHAQWEVPSDACAMSDSGGLSLMTLATMILTPAVLVVVGVLVIGIILFMCGGEINRRHGLKLMNMRVATQAAALLLVTIILLIQD